MTTSRCGVALTMAWAVLAAPALAEEGTASPSLSLDALVVTGTRTETLVKDSPVSVTVIDADQIERADATSVADILRDVPGVSIDESSLAGMKRIRIRGEEARRAAVLIDGQEITDHTSYGAPILIDPAMIERIELVRGPASVLHGSKAIGGVLNIITKKGGAKPLEGSAGASYLSATRGYTANALVRGSYNGWDYRLFAGRTEEGDRRAPSGRLPNTNSDSKSLSGYVGYGWDDHKLGVSLDRYELSSGSFVEPSTLGRNFSKFQLDMPKRDLTKAAVAYDWKNPSPLLAKLHVDAYYQTVDRKFTQKVASGPAFGTGPTGPGSPVYFDLAHTDTQRTLGGTVQLDWTPHPDHVLVTGVQVLRDELDKSMTRTGLLKNFPLGIRTCPRAPTPCTIATSTPAAVNSFADMDAHMQTASVFVEDTWTLPADFSLVGGARYYWIKSALDSVTTNDAGFRRRSGSDSAPVGSLALLYSGLPSTTLRAGFSQGFVYPTLLQSYTGSYFGTFTTTRPNPALKPETSNNYEIGARYAGRDLTLDVAMFHSSSRNYIASASCSDAPNVGCSGLEGTYVNVDRARTFGVELAGEYRLGDSGFVPYASGTLLRRSYSYRTLETYRTGVPTLSGRIGLRHEANLWDKVAVTTDVYMRGATSADELSQDTRGLNLTEVDGWRTFNASFDARFQGYRVGLDLLNLTNTTYRSNPDEMVQPGRSAVLSLRADF